MEHQADEVLKILKRFLKDPIFNNYETMLNEKILMELIFFFFLENKLALARELARMNLFNVYYI